MRLHVSYVYSNDTKHINHFVTTISCNFFLQFLVSLELYFPPNSNVKIVFSPASFSISFPSSMDVQGDYDPCDASGFIRINAVRLASHEL